MHCPAEVAAAILRILSMGLLATRIAGWDGDAGRAAVEADHLHNLPSLLSDFSPARLRYYLEAEVPCYRSYRLPAGLDFRQEWDRLAAWLANHPEG